MAYKVHKAPPKPSVPSCPHCDGAYWRYNGSSWYACDRTTKKLHVCAAPELWRKGANSNERLLCALNSSPGNGGMQGGGGL
jgi:hypothetical protein